MKTRSISHRTTPVETTSKKCFSLHRHWRGRGHRGVYCYMGHGCGETGKSIGANQFCWRKSIKWWHPNPNSLNKYEWILFCFTFISKLNLLVSVGLPPTITSWPEEHLRSLSLLKLRGFGIFDGETWREHGIIITLETCPAHGIWTSSFCRSQLKEGWCSW